MSITISHVNLPLNSKLSIVHQLIARVSCICHALSKQLYFLYLIILLIERTIATILTTQTIPTTIVTLIKITDNLPDNVRCQHYWRYYTMSHRLYLTWSSLFFCFVLLLYFREFILFVSSFIGRFEHLSVFSLNLFGRFKPRTIFRTRCSNCHVVFGDNNHCRLYLHSKSIREEYMGNFVPTSLLI